MSNFFTIRKTAPGDFYLELRSINDDQKHRIVTLTQKMDFARLQQEYAMWIFFDPSLFKMLEQGYITFDEDIKEVTQVAIDEGVYFGEVEDIKIASADQSKEILEILKSGQKARIEGLLNRTPEDIVLAIAVGNIDSLTAGTIRLLEQKTGKQLIVDEQ